jgi:D-alanyl-D-alanine carboxypeptidase
MLALGGCTAAPLEDGQHEACELEPQWLPGIDTSGAVEDGADSDEIATSSEALSISCNMSSTTGYTHGTPFKIKVVTVDGKKVEWKTANAFMRMAKAAAKSGVYISVVSGFRSHSEQTYLYNCYKTCSCNGCNLAATPGYSNHQSGHALDLNASSPGVYSWLSKHAGSYGFKRTVPSENWHWEFWGKDNGKGPCNAKHTLKAKLTKKSTNLKKYRGKKAHYRVCAGEDFRMAFTFKNTGSAVWKDVQGRGKDVGNDVYLVTANGKTDRLTGKKRYSVRLNRNRVVKGDRKGKNCSTKNGCKRTTFVKGSMRAHAPKKPGIYKTRWRLRDYSKEWGKKSKGFGPKAELKIKVEECAPKTCSCSLMCSDGSLHKVTTKCSAQGNALCDANHLISKNPCSASGGASSSTTSTEPDAPADPEEAEGTPEEGDLGGDEDLNGYTPVDEEGADLSALDEQAQDENGEAIDEIDDPDFEEDGFDGDDDGLVAGPGADAGCAIVSPGRGSTGTAMVLWAVGVLGLVWARRRRGGARVSLGRKAK